MRSHKADENSSNGEFDDNYKSVFVSSNVKYIMLVTCIICRWEIILNFSQIMPISIKSRAIPPL